MVEEEIPFEQRYPNAEYLWMPEYSNMMKGSSPGPCWVCKRDTSWIEINFEAYVCSEKCENLGWKWYFEATSLDQVSEF